MTPQSQLRPRPLPRLPSPRATPPRRARPPSPPPRRRRSSRRPLSWRRARSRKRRQKLEGCIHGQTIVTLDTLLTTRAHINSRAHMPISSNGSRSCFCFHLLPWYQTISERLCLNISCFTHRIRIWSGVCLSYLTHSSLHYRCIKSSFKTSTTLQVELESATSLIIYAPISCIMHLTHMYIIITASQHQHKNHRLMFIGFWMSNECHRNVLRVQVQNSTCRKMLICYEMLLMNRTLAPLQLTIDSRDK